MKSNSTKVITGIVRLSYEHVWEPSSIDGNSEPKYSASFIIDKDDTKTLDAINTAIENAIKEGIGKFGGKIPNRAALKLPLRDGDAKEDEAYQGHFFVNANSKVAPQIVDKAVNPILDRDEVYSGCYVRASLNFYPYNFNGTKGVACGLGNIQKVKDGPALGGGRSSASDDFNSDDMDDFLA